MLLVGGGALRPEVVYGLSNRLGVQVRPAPAPHTAAVRGAATGPRTRVEPMLEERGRSERAGKQVRRLEVTAMDADGDAEHETHDGPEAVEVPEDFEGPKTAGTAGDPDVLLDVPSLSVEEINLEVENLRARVSLQAEVLDLLKLNVGADVDLGRVHLDIKGVEAQALLKVRLDNVVEIVGRVLSTIDRNPQILEQITSGVGSAVREVGGGAREAVGELGRGAGAAVEDVGEGAGQAVEDVGSGAGQAVEDVGSGAGGAVEGVGEGAGQAVEDVGSGAGQAVEDVGDEAGEAVEEAGRGARKAAGAAEGATGRASAKAAGGASRDTSRQAGRARRTARKATGDSRSGGRRQGERPP